MKYIILGWLIATIAQWSVYALALGILRPWQWGFPYKSLFLFVEVLFTILSVCLVVGLQLTGHFKKKDI